jgi:hypothetical protein
VAEDGERENFHRSARTLPAAREHASHISRRHDTAGHRLTSRLCRLPAHDRQTDVLTRLRIIAPPAVVEAAVALHAVDHLVADTALASSAVPDNDTWQ